VKNKLKIIKRVKIYIDIQQRRNFMNKRLILFSVLIIFLSALTIGCISAETFELKPVEDQYISKESGDYKIEVYQWHTPSYREVDVFVYKNGKYIDKKEYASQVFYEDHGELKKTPWFRGNQAAVYHKHHFDNSYEIQKVKVKI